MPLSEDFAAWLDQPVKKLVFRALRAAQDAQKAQWDAASWDGGERRADQLKELLAELRVRADCYGALSEMSFDDVTEWLGIEDGK